MNKSDINQNIEDGLPLRLRTYDYEGIAKRLKNMERHDDIIKQLRRKIIEEPLDSRTLPPAATIHFQRILDAYDKLNKTSAVKKFKDDEEKLFYLTAKVCLLDNLEEKREAVKELQELGVTNNQIKEMKKWFEREIIPDLKSKEEAVKELKERFGKKTVFNNLTIESLVKLANLLDEEGFHSIANIIDESTKKIIDIKPTSRVEVIADRCVDEIGKLLKEKKDIDPKIRKRLVNIILSLESLKADLDPESLLGIANILDSIGLVKVADDVDKLIILAKAELKPPKKWWAKMKAELKEKNPNYNYKRIGEIIRNIWNTQIDEKKKREICKEYKK